MKARSLFILITAFAIMSANSRPIGFGHATKPALLRSSSKAAPAVTITAQDLYGFWVIDDEDTSSGSNDGLTIAAEYFFNSNGKFEYRFHVAELPDSAGQTPKILLDVHVTGTWNVDADSLYARMEACKGTDSSDCSEPISNASLANMEMKITNGRKTLDGLLYKGPTPNFTLQPLLPNAVFQAPLKRPQAARSSLVFRFASENLSGTVMDLAGRTRSSMTAAGVTITSNR